LTIDREIKIERACQVVPRSASGRGWCEYTHTQTVFTGRY